MLLQAMINTLWWYWSLSVIWTIISNEELEQNMEIVETLVKDSQILININTKKTEKKQKTIAWFLGTLADTLDASVLGNMSTGDSCQLNIKLKICILKLTKITKNNNPELNDLGIDDSQRFKVTPTHIWFMYEEKSKNPGKYIIVNEFSYIGLVFFSVGGRSVTVA